MFLYFKESDKKEDIVIRNQIKEICQNAIGNSKGHSEKKYYRELINIIDSDTKLISISKTIKSLKNKEDYLQRSSNKMLFSQLHVSGRLDYEKIKETCYIDLIDQEEYDINVILPVRGRDEFVIPCIEHLKKSAENSGAKICITLCEENDKPNHKEKASGLVNYIHIPSENKLMNKSLAHNCGFKYSNKAKYYLFHDIDILVQTSFFEKTILNLKEYSVGALQTFSNRRVLNLSKELTEAIIKLKKSDVDQLHQDSYGIEIPQTGAPGGSIIISKDLFIEVGGYDPEFFYGYSPEDKFFWDKIEAIQPVEFPSIDVDLFHLHHEVMIHKNPKLWEMHSLLDTFNYMSEIEKKLFLKAKRNYLGE